MRVSSKWYVIDVEGQKVTLRPVVRGVENREWASATPGGFMEMYISNPAALAQFIKGEEYTGLFEHCAKPAPGDGHPVKQLEQKYAGYPDKIYFVCETCGSYASLNDDSTPNWSRHEELFGPTETLE